MQCKMPLLHSGLVSDFEPQLVLQPGVAYSDAYLPRPLNRIRFRAPAGAESLGLGRQKPEPRKYKRNENNAIHH